MGIAMSTAKVMFEIISTFVGYNILHILIVQPLQRESCSSLNSTFWKRENTSLPAQQQEEAARVTDDNDDNNAWSMVNDNIGKNNYTDNKLQQIKAIMWQSTVGDGDRDASSSNTKQQP